MLAVSEKNLDEFLAPKPFDECPALLSVALHWVAKVGLARTYTVGLKFFDSGELDLD